MIDIVLAHIPADGTPVGNIALKKRIADSESQSLSDAEYQQVRDYLVDQGILAKGGGKGGSVRRIMGKKIINQAITKDGNAILQLEKEPAKNPQQTIPTRRRQSTTGKRASKGDERKIISYRYNDKRKNNPPVGLVDTTSDGVEEQVRWAYDPHLDPELQFDVGRSRIEKIIDDALSSGDSETMQQALEQLRRMQEPYLNWTGKSERTSFNVDTVSLHVHERIDPTTILSVAQKFIGKSKPKPTKHFQTELFSAPFENLPMRQAIDFYKHERDWANRIISGDSLLVMNSLIRKESMAGQVQMIYLDPPYGIKYGSNFQPFVNKRDVKDRKDEDLTQEPEMIKAFRDTWELGLHSYLTYLRDRLLLAKELLHESGSVFVQISDENLHHVRELMDEVFGHKNCVGQIVIQKTGGFTKKTLQLLEDYVIWYSKDISNIKFHEIRKFNNSPSPNDRYYRRIQLDKGNWRWMTSEESENPDSLGSDKRIFRHGPLNSHGPSSNPKDFIFQGKKYSCNPNRHWTVDAEQYLPRVSRAGYVFAIGNDVAFKLFWDFNPSKSLGNVWLDTQSGGFNDPQIYAVQTTTKVIERCLLMTTDPGDLVLDPTCGSGTTAYVAEKWGRRWITCDTSRVAVTLAKQRLMTANYDYYELKYPHDGIKGGFIYKTVPHITLKSIANNPDIDEIHERMHPVIKTKLEALNTALRGHDVPFTVSEGGRKGQVVSFKAKTAEEISLPSGEPAPAGALLEWEVPFDFPGDWPEKARNPFEDFHKSRQAMQKKMDQSIAAHADHEVLYDQPDISKTKLRITGPFTVEAVPFPTVLSLDEASQPEDADVAVARSGETARQALWRDELLKTGVRGKGGQKLQLADLEPLPDCRYLHAVGTVAETGERVTVSFGPEYAALEQRQVEIAMREAGNLFPLPKILIFCAFTFDPEAAKDIDTIKGVTALKVQMNTDLLTEDLKTKRTSNESFWLMGQPDVEIRKIKNGRFQVEVHGFDYFDTKTGELVSGGKNKIAMWELDTDYDDRSLYPRQVFFPMAGAKDGWYKLKKDIRAELNEEALDQFHSTISLPFEPGDNRRIAVKIIDDRGIESLKIMDLD